VKGGEVPSDIILIGPVQTGKSTQGKLLAEKLDLPQSPMDDCRWDYYREIGYDESFADILGKKVGFWALYMYWKEFECHAVQRLLTEHSNCVIDFGAGHSVYEIDTHFARVEKVMRPYRNIVLILPSPDRDESVRLLHERTGTEVQPDDLDISEHFVRHHSNYDLAKHTVYTKGKAPEETRDEILDLVDLAD
jgi:shikimate kinase